MPSADEWVPSLGLMLVPTLRTCVTAHTKGSNNVVNAAQADLLMALRWQTHGLIPVSILTGWMRVALNVEHV